MNVTIYALHLGHGGVEKYVCTLANMLVEKYNIEIISTYQVEKEPAFYLDDRVVVTYLLKNQKPNREAIKDAKTKRKIWQLGKEVCRALRLLYRKKSYTKRSIKNLESDVVISTRIFHNELIQKYAKKDIIKITGEHNHPNGDDAYFKEVIASCKGFDYFIPISKALCDMYEPVLAPYGVEVRYIPFCVETLPGALTIDVDRKRLISVGRLSPEKGFLDLIDVFASVYEKDNSFTLDLFGDGEQREEIKNKINSLHLQSHVHLHGFVDLQELYNQYRLSSCFLMTSFSESLGFVLLEAMSCGLPCIAFDSAQGANELITDKKDGYLIPNRDIEQMAKQILEVHDNEKAYLKLSKEALIKASKYSYENTQKKWLALFETFHK